MNMPDGQILECSITRIQEDGTVTAATDVVVRELQLRVVVNDRELVVASMMPGMEREFTYGLLLAAGIINTAQQVTDWKFDSQRQAVFAEIAGELPAAVAAMPPVVLGTARGSKPLAPSAKELPSISSQLRVSARALLSAVEAFQMGSKLFKETGGVHSVALCRRDGAILFRADDVGRHNACDKAIGACLLKGDVAPAECFMVCTCRLSSEMMTKAWRYGLPLVASQSAVTSRALEIAKLAGITLAGFARDGRFNIYSGSERIEEAG